MSDSGKATCGRLSLYQLTSFIKMLLLTLIINAIYAEERASCYWPTTNESGKMISCMPGYYIKGACESYQHPECKINTGIQKALNGIKCCPVTDELNFDNRSNCIYIGQNRLMPVTSVHKRIDVFSGHNLACPYNTAAFGRCSSSSPGRDDCSGTSHQVE